MYRNHKQEFIERSIKLWGEGVYLYDKVDINHSKDRVTLTCIRHDETFVIRADNHLGKTKAYIGCSLCIEERRKLSKENEKPIREALKLKTQKRNEKRKLLSQEIQGYNNYIRFVELLQNVKRRSIAIHGDVFDFSLVDVKGRYRKFDLICKKCGKTFKTCKNTLIKEKCGCPYCAVNSKLEKRCETFFTEHSIEYIKQYTFEPCRFTKALCRFDFYLPKFNMIIETHGQQHFKFVEYFHRTESEFIRRCNVDKFKAKCAVDCGYWWVVIRYDANVEWLLRKLLIENTQ